MYWNIIIISLCTLLLLFLLWKETRRPNRSALTARLISTVIAVISLACIALPVSISRPRAINENSIAIILTEGYRVDSAAKIIKAHKDPKIFTVNKNIKSFDARYVADIASFLQDSLKNDAVHIFGYGLEDEDLHFITNKGLTFHPTTVDNLITSISWTQTLRSGEEFRVQGRFQNSKRGDAKIVLRGFDTNHDSVIIKAGQTASFALTTVPKHIDKAVYTLSVLSAGDTLESNPLPIEVIMPETLSILVLAASPDFENKFLKNWLSQNEYSFAVRTSISKNKYDKQYINIASMGLDRITSSLLEKFDIVIADLSELKSLSSSDLGTLRSHVENKGLGLVVRAGNAEVSSAFYLQPFPLLASRDSTRHTLKLRLGATDILSPLKIEQPLYIRNVAGTQSLIKDNQQRTVVSRKMLGEGNIILTTIPNTYSWWLAGNDSDYTSYWTFLLQKAARKAEVSHFWKMNVDLPRVNKEIQLRFQSGNTLIPQIHTGRDMLYPAQDHLLRYEWKARYWPVKTGWQTLMYNDSATSSWYIQDAKHWQGIQATQRIYWTRKYAGENFKGTSSILNSLDIVPIPKIYFFLLFVLFSGLLWFEKKYRSGDVS